MRRIDSLFSVGRRLGLALLATGSLVGCQSVDPQGPAFNDPLADWSQNVRSEQADGTSFGLSTKSRQIERNLGVR